jgi:hypothetical protein
VIKKTVTYANLFTGEPVTKDLYFHLDAAELAEMTVVQGEGWLEKLETLSQKNDGATIMREFKQMLSAAYGERDGDDLITSEDSGGEFFSALIPKDLEKYADQIKNNPSLAKASKATDPTDKRPAWIREDREPTAKELQSMTKAQMVEVMERRARKNA